ncbi:tetratricopeptide repeat protein [candidate division KSB1 bacterium]
MQCKAVIIFTFISLFTYCTASKYATGDNLLISGSPTEAVDAYKKLTEADPYDPLAFVRLGDAYLAMNNYDDATKAYDEALFLQPDLLEAAEKWQKTRLGKGLDHMAQENYRNAIDVFEYLLKKYPENTTVLKPLAECYTKSNRIDKARESYKTYIAVNTEDTVAVTALKVLDTKTVQAEKIYTTALEDYERGMFYEAAEMLKEAIELKPDYIDARYLSHIATGRHHLRRSDQMELWDAIAAFGMCTTLKPDEIEPHFYMAQAYAKKDKTKFAENIKRFRKIIETAPDSEFAKQSEKKVKELTELMKFYKIKRDGSQDFSGLN